MIAYWLKACVDRGAVVNRKVLDCNRSTRSWCALTRISTVTVLLARRYTLQPVRCNPINVVNLVTRCLPEERVDVFFPNLQKVVCRILLGPLPYLYFTFADNRILESILWFIMVLLFSQTAARGQSVSKFDLLCSFAHKGLGLDLRCKWCLPINLRVEFVPLPYLYFARTSVAELVRMCTGLFHLCSSRVYNVLAPTVLVTSQTEGLANFNSY